MDYPLHVTEQQSTFRRTLLLGKTGSRLRAVDNHNMFIVFKRHLSCNQITFQALNSSRTLFSSKKEYAVAEREVQRLAQLLGKSIVERRKCWG